MLAFHLTKEFLQTSAGNISIWRRTQPSPTMAPTVRCRSPLWKKDVVYWGDNFWETFNWHPTPVRLAESHPDRWFRVALKPLYEKARLAVAEYVGSDQNNLVFITNATAAVNTVVKHLSLGPEDMILCTSHTYNACYQAVHSAVRWGEDGSPSSLISEQEAGGRHHHHRHQHPHQERAGYRGSDRGDLQEECWDQASGHWPHLLPLGPRVPGGGDNQEAAAARSPRPHWRGPRAWPAGAEAGWARCWLLHR